MRYRIFLFFFVSQYYNFPRRTHDHNVITGFNVLHFNSYKLAGKLYIYIFFKIRLRQKSVNTLVSQKKLYGIKQCVEYR